MRRRRDGLTVARSLRDLDTLGEHGGLVLEHAKQLPCQSILASRCLEMSSIVARPSRTRYALMALP